MGDGRRKGYRVYSANIGDGSDAAIKKAEESIQTIYEHETRIIEDEDVPIVQRINYQTGGFLVQADKQLATYLHYVDKYPRIRMAELIQSAEKPWIGTRPTSGEKTCPQDASSRSSRCASSSA